MCLYNQHVLLNKHVFIGQDVVFIDDMLYEGSTCLSSENDIGQCTKRSECPEYKKYTSADRACGFVKKNLLVCCPLGEYLISLIIVRHKS